VGRSLFNFFITSTAINPTAINVPPPTTQPVGKLLPDLFPVSPAGFPSLKALILAKLLRASCK